MRSRNVCVEWEGESPTHVSAPHRMPVDPDSLVSLAAAKVYGIWFMVYDLWFMVSGLWFMVYGLWFRV